MGWTQIVSVENCDIREDGGGVRSRVAYHTPIVGAAAASAPFSDLTCYTRAHH